MSEEIQRQGLETLNRLIETNQLQLIWLAPLVLAAVLLVMAVVLGVAIITFSRQDRGGNLVLLKVLEIYGAFITTLQAIQTTVAALKDAQQQSILRHEINSGKMDQIITSSSTLVASNEAVVASVDALKREIQNYSQLAAESTTNFQDAITEQIEQVQQRQAEITAFIENHPQMASVKDIIDTTAQQVIAQLVEAGRLLPAKETEATT